VDGKVDGSDEETIVIGKLEGDKVGELDGTKERYTEGPSVGIVVGSAIN